jgi:hypothetical protein
MLGWVLGLLLTPIISLVCGIVLCARGHSRRGWPLIGYSVVLWLLMTWVLTSHPELNPFA